jgi:hypothetical protein
MDNFKTFSVFCFIDAIFYEVHADHMKLVFSTLAYAQNIYSTDGTPDANMHMRNVYFYYNFRM